MEKLMREEGENSKMRKLFDLHETSQQQHLRFGKSKRRWGSNKELTADFFGCFVDEIVNAALVFNHGNKCMREGGWPDGRKMEANRRTNGDPSNTHPES